MIAFFFLLSICITVSVKANPDQIKILIIDPFREFSGYKFYSRFIELLKDNGFSVEFLYDTDLSLGTLSSYDVIIVPDLYLVSEGQGSLLTNEQIAVIIYYVENGGGLYLIEGETPTLLSEFFKIHVTEMQLYDEEMHLKFYDDPRDVSYGQVTVKEISYNVEEVVIPKCSALQVGEGVYPLIKINNSTQVQLPNGELRNEANVTPIAYSVHGKGRVIAVGSLFLHNNFYIFSKDNPQFIVNMFRWLAKKKPIAVSVKSNMFRTYTYLGLLVFLLLIGTAFIWKSPSLLPKGLKLKLTLRIFLSILTVVYVIFLIFIVLLSMSPMGSSESSNLKAVIENITSYNAHIYLAVLVICFLFFENIWGKADPELVQNMVKLALSTGIAFILPTVYIYIFWFLESDIINPLWFFVISSLAAWGTYFWAIILLWIGLPIFWLWFRGYFETEIIYPELLETGLSIEKYRKLFHVDFYGNFIFKIAALIVLVATLPKYVLYMYSMLWGGELYRIELFYLLRFNVFLVIAFTLAFFMLRKAVEAGLTDMGKINELKDLIFARELPYLIIAMFVVPDILKLLFGISDPFYVLINLIGIFAAYGVGYASVRVLFTNIPRLLASLIAGLIIMLYQWIINTFFLKKITSFIEQTALSGMLSFLISAGVKSLQKDFEKALKKASIVKKVISQLPVPPEKRVQELKELLEKLDKALVEGRIDLETYRILKKKYEEELKRISK